jgi:hypothetical protein
MKEIPKNTRLVLAILAVTIGIFLIIAVPFIVQTALDRVLTALLKVIEKEPQFSSGLTLFSFFYPLWRSFCFVAGITLLAIARPIYQGADWTFPVGLSAYAVPSVGGMFMFLPYISFVGGFPLPMVLSWVGLAGFWTMLLLQKSDRMQKLVDFLVFTFIGMLTTHAFVIGIGAQRMLMTRPEKPLFAGLEWWLLTLSGEVNWIAVVMLLISIPLLALRRSSGWWLAFLAALAILAIDAPTQLVRTKTLDYLYGSLLSAGLLLWLSLPAFKPRLAGER